MEKERIEKIKPEIVFGLVGAVGTDLDSINRFLMDSLREFGYTSEIISLSSLLRSIDKEPWSILPIGPDIKEDVRITQFMNAGNAFRKETERGDALALFSILKIRESRKTQTGDATTPFPGHSYILKSLKHPEEAKCLRETYGPNFILISAYSSRDYRIKALAKKIAKSYRKSQIRNFIWKAEELIDRDESETEIEFGQNVRDTFPLADVFIDSTSTVEFKKSLNRFLEMIFNYPYHTPTRDEFAMFHAKAAALRSASPARQVGAVITTPNGDIVAVGTNEVPKAHGGLCWCEDSPDHREYVKEIDSEYEMKVNIFSELLERFKEQAWLSSNKMSRSTNELVQEAFHSGSPPLMSGMQLMNIIEFGRTVHAEMAAICDAACRGVSIKGHILYTSTFPCHLCARHIIASGLTAVVYIEPYPKSLVEELYPESISIDKAEDGTRLVFRPFAGVSPTLYMSLFSSEEKRKKENGKLLPWKRADQIPRILDTYPFNTIHLETYKLDKFYKILSDKYIPLKNA